ncbi:hypothetical protein V6N11_066086 [Hibiscus sabdariffa]|uniref:Uncharacterized protein n=1 Tax=Hibiscus sabdariffa TaxID=183260 RepID=A0ABR2NUN9_9ROSI
MFPRCDVSLHCRNLKLSALHQRQRPRPIHFTHQKLVQTWIPHNHNTLPWTSRISHFLLFKMWKTKSFKHWLGSLSPYISQEFGSGLPLLLARISDPWHQHNLFHLCCPRQALSL